MANELTSDLDKQLEFVLTFAFYSSNVMTPVRRKFRKFDILKSRQNRIYPNRTAWLRHVKHIVSEQAPWGFGGSRFALGLRTSPQEL